MQIHLLDLQGSFQHDKDSEGHVADVSEALAHTILAIHLSHLMCLFPLEFLSLIFYFILYSVSSLGSMYLCGN